MATDLSESDVSNMTLRVSYKSSKEIFQPLTQYLLSDFPGLCICTNPTQFLKLQRKEALHNKHNENLMTLKWTAQRQQSRCEDSTLWSVCNRESTDNEAGLLKQIKPGWSCCFSELKLIKRSLMAFIWKTYTTNLVSGNKNLWLIKDC